MTKCEDIQEIILEGIREGIHKEGERLPSCRKLASQLKVNKITVNKAYECLEQQHYVYSIPRGGYYVVHDLPEGKTSERLIDFTAVKPQEELIPFRAFTHAMNKAIDIYKGTLFSDNSPMGMKSLREALVDMFAKESIYCTADGLMVTHGAQQGIDLVLQALFLGQQGQLLIESPTYSLALKRARQLNIDMVTIERSDQGLDIAFLEDLFKTHYIKCFYIMPRYHNPTGYSLSETQKRQIVTLCAKYKVFIIEDDYLGDLRDKQAGAPMHYYDTENTVIYLRSFSKTFMPSIRLGALVCPHVLMQELVAIKKTVDLSTAALSQSALEVFICSGMYEKHKRKIKKIYDEKLKRCRHICASLASDSVKWHVPTTGIFIWIELPEIIDFTGIQRALRDENIIVKDSSAFYYKEQSKHFLRLCILSVSEKELHALSTVLKAL